MDALTRIAEQRITEAMARGDLDDVPGKGKPLDLEDLSGMPEDLRVGYLVLRNAGFVPEEVELKRQVRRLDDLIRACLEDGDAGRRERLCRERNQAVLRYEMLRDRGGLGSGTWAAHRQYADKIQRRLLG